MLTSLHMPEVHECIKPKTSEIHSIHLLVTWYKKRDKLLFLNVVLYLHKIILIYSTSKQFTAGKPNIEVPLLPYTSKGSSNTLRTSLCNSTIHKRNNVQNIDAALHQAVERTFVLRKEREI